MCGGGGGGKVHKPFASGGGGGGKSVPVCKKGDGWRAQGGRSHRAAVAAASVPVPSMCTPSPASADRST